MLAEQRVLVKLEPLFGLDACPTQVDQVDEHGEEENDQGDDYNDLEHLSVRGSCGSLVANLNVGFDVVTIKDSVVRESCHGSLAKSHLFVFILICITLRFNAEHALSGGGNFVGEIRAEHVVGRINVVLERIFRICNDDVDRRHCMKISFVTVASVGLRGARVQCLSCVLSLLVACVRWDHKCVRKVVVEVLR